MSAQFRNKTRIAGEGSSLCFTRAEDAFVYMQITEEAVLHEDAFAELVRLGVAADPSLQDHNSRQRAAASAAGGQSLQFAVLRAME